MTNKDILPLFNEQVDPLIDENLEFSAGWINPAKFKRLMDSGPIPVGEAGQDAYKVIFRDSFNEDEMIDDFWLDWRDNGPEFDGRITMLKAFEMNRQFWWIKIPDVGKGRTKDMSLYLWSKQNLAPETWQVYTSWLDEQQRDKDISSLGEWKF